MQSINKKQGKKKFALIAIVVVAVLAVGGYIGAQALLKDEKPVAVETAPVGGINYQPPRQVEEEQQDAQKDDIIKQYEQSQDPQQPANVANITFNRVSQDGAGQPLNVRVTIAGVSTGECVVQATKAGQATVTRTFEVVWQATYASCQGADIPADSFGAGGDWDIIVTVNKDGQAQGSATTKTTIQK